MATPTAYPRTLDPSNDPTKYSVPRESKDIFLSGIINNPLLNAPLPKGFKEFAKHVSFEGSDFPLIPINWRFAESMASLLALEATAANYLATKKYEVDSMNVTINT